MAELTPDERLDNLESGIVAAANDLHEALSDPEIDAAMEEIRLRINNLHRRFEALAQTVETAYSIIAGPPEE